MIKDLDISKIRIGDITPSENLTRDISEKGLKVLDKSINTFGLVEPILINLKKNNTIISGHQRYHVLYNNFKDGLEEEYLNLIPLGDIGWVFSNKKLELDSDDMETQLSLILNSHQGKWVKKELIRKLEDLKLKGLDISLTGMDNIKLNKIDEKLDKEEDLDEKPVKPVKCPQCGCEFNLGDK